MTESQREQVDDLFGDLLEQEPETWPAALAAVTDLEVRAKVQLLLRHSAPTAKGLDTSIAEVMRAATVSGAFDDRTIGPGTRFERYRIERKIGQGGMGDVYEAVRENDFHKRVALKIVRYGLDSDYARGRFQQERQTLAGLEHPFIARLLDGGEAENGCPYLVLEFVDGVPIDTFCEGRPQNEILQLFLKVCEAVEYAHRNLVIHRDLKPANILVTADCDPKLLDFGIAKLLGPTANVTQTTAVALTPQYASPEQIRNQPITTASDVYSLGVILYQLLTGRKPYQVETTTALEMERVICLEAPAAPHIGNELDDILMMALRKEPERRYTGVAQFAQDIERYLDGRPVLAAPDTLGYRSRKFFGRHKIGIAAVTAVILVLAGGFASTLYQKRQAEQRFLQVRELANTFLFDFNDQIADIAGTTKARAFVVETAQKYLDNLSKSAGNDPGLQAELAQAYQRVADAQGRPRKPNLGDPKGAEASYKRAISLYEPLLRKHPQYTADAARCWNLLAYLYVNQNRLDEAGKALDRAFALAEPLRQQPSGTALLVFAGLYQTAADLSERRDDIPQGILNNRQAVDFTTRWSLLQPPSDAANTASQLGMAHLRLGRSLGSLGKLSEAESELKAAFVNDERALALNPQNARFRAADTSLSLNLMALDDAPTTPSLERPRDAIPYGRRAIELTFPLVEADPNDLQSRMNYLEALLGLARALSVTKQSDGLPEMKKALAVWDEVSGQAHMTPGRRLTALDQLRSVISVFSRVGKHSEAQALAAMVLRERRKLLVNTAATNDDLWYIAEDLLAAAEAARAAGDVATSGHLIQEAVHVSAPFAAAAGQIVPTALAASSLYDAAAREAATSGRCEEARTWRAKDVAVWTALAAANEYAATRLHRAQSELSACSK